MEEVRRRMKGITRKRTILLAAVIVAVGLGVIYLTSVGRERTRSGYEFAKITKGGIENTVSATGTLSAVGTVEIGTQVSGTIAEIRVDFNDTVSKGQILAVLDTTMLAAAVLDAEAGLASAQAQYDQAYSEYERNRQLFEEGYLAEKEFLPIRVAVQIREAALKSARALLDRAQANLRNAVIRSPIDGSVIQRTVEPGQTVAASLSSPTLFIVAKDLSKMEILAAVDENDIGQVKEGQAVRFTVQAYPDETFEGAVRQIQLQPETVQNVVNYTVVVDAPNSKGLLLPGMTATVDFIIDQRKDVLLVPSAALRLTPTEEMIAEARKAFAARRERQEAQTAGEEPSGPSAGADSERRVSMMGAVRQGAWPDRGDLKSIWYLGENGKTSMQMVKIGITDGRMTELVSGRDIKEGMEIITGIGQGSAESAQRQPQMRAPGFRIF